MRAPGRVLGDPELDAIFAAVIHLARTALDELPEEPLNARPTSILEVIALVRGDVDRQLAHMVTDLLATHLADIFGSMNLMPPMDRDDDTLPVFRVPVPAPDVLAPRLRFAAGATMIEVFGAERVLEVFARPVDRQPT